VLAKESKMDLLVLLPAPLITLATAIVKKLGLPDGAAPWVALGGAIVTTITIHVFGVTDNVIEAGVALLVGWLGSMGTWEGIKNLFLRQLPSA
jgi:hypothetical protein